MKLHELTRPYLLTEWANAHGITTLVDTWFPEGQPMMIIKFIFPKEINAEYSHLFNLADISKTKSPEIVMSAECYKAAVKIAKVLEEGCLT